MTADMGYLLYIKTKYTKDFTKNDVLKLKAILQRGFELGLPIGLISNEKKSAIEIGTLGKELGEMERKYDRWVLNTPKIVFSFCNHEIEKDEEETLEQVSQSIKKIRESILNNLSIEAREKYLCGYEL